MVIGEDTSHILVVDDDNRIRELLCKYLYSKGFLVSTAQDTIEARKLFTTFTFDLLILDVMLPGETGKEFARMVRAKSDVPILMLTAMGEVEERISGLESGADDYLSKPFEPRELLLRVGKIISRSTTKERDNANNIICFGECEFNLVNHRLTKGGINILLTQTEANLLFILAQNFHQIVSRSTLAKLCGGINERSVDVQIIRLRNKIENDPKKPLYVQSIRGEGYILYK
ncbi:Transcriptional regulatory protein OmpR [Rickettsiales bacterium Ac37b]|nr:Transcriptional regulatory protein OmpR [Rickettsiales bacterium Ac37b]